MWVLPATRKSRSPAAKPPVGGTGLWARMKRSFTLTPINQRRWYNFKANRRGYWSLWVFLGLFVVSMFADVIANDRPIIASYKGEILLPIAL